MSSSVFALLSPVEAVKLRLSSVVAVMTGIHTLAVPLKSDRTCGSAAMVVDIISSTSSNFADNLSNSLAISNCVDKECRVNRYEKISMILNGEQKKNPVSGNG